MLVFFISGFSFTDSDEGYAQNESDVGTDLYNMMTQFYQLFPELLRNKLFITGESYAGKFSVLYIFICLQSNGGVADV